MDEQEPSGSHYFGRRIDAEPSAAGSAPAREPFSRAPLPALLLAGSILVAFAWQRGAGDVAGWNDAWGLRPDDLRSSHGLLTLLTSLWSHESWEHAGTNAVFALAFGAPVSRLFGLGVRGYGLLALFYLLGGVIASLAFSVLHLGGDILLVGASGAVSALGGAASRLIFPRQPLSVGAAPLAPIISAPVIVMTSAFVIANLILGLVGADLGGTTTPLAWEAHLAGYATGLFMIGPFAELARAPPQSRPQDD